MKQSIPLERAEDGYRLQSLLKIPESGGPPPAAAFGIGFRDTDGSAVEFSEADFQMQAVLQDTTSSFRFYDNPKLPEMEVVLSFRKTPGRICCSAQVIGTHESLILEWLEPVKPVIDKTGTQLVLPVSEGVLVDLETASRRQPRPASWHNYTFYPGAVEAQFLAVITQCHGLYFAAHDPTHATKFIQYRPLADSQFQLVFRFYCGDGKNGDYRLPGELILEKFSGDWMDAAEFYRNWMEHDPLLPPKGVLPTLVKDSPVVVIYPVRGRGDDSGKMETNEYYPYQAAAPALERLSDVLGSKLMALLMHWEGTAPWAPPYVWPPLGGEEALAKLRDWLHSQGHYLGVYCSGYAWTQFSYIDLDYSREEQFEREHLVREMIRGPHGELDAYICCGWASQRDGFDLCLGREWSRRTIRTEIGKLADFGVDYAQFFDQNIGGAAHCCWSREHGHPPVPGVWQTAAMRTLLQDIHKAFPRLTVGCEAAAAQPYLGFLSFNDLRTDCWTLGNSRSIPLYAYLFHEYINNFMGNQCGLGQRIDFQASPENLLWRTAKAFNAGNLLSVVLKDGGKVHWGWTVPWEASSEPDQEHILALVRNLNMLRRKYPQYLCHGRMEKPMARVAGGKWTLRLLQNKGEEYDSFLHSTWRAPDGSQAMFITNFLPQPQNVILTWQGNVRELALPPLNAIVLTESSLSKENHHG
ncbi:MAG: hypothetical protein IJJ33_13480 [Victivallales bacterium]|nr:hypothetical protein [Victivallales bacterium]